MIIELNKEYKTKSGLPVRIYAVDGGGEYPVHGAQWNEEDKFWSNESWTAEGNLVIYSVGSLDLVEVKKTITIERYVNVYDCSHGTETFWHKLESHARHGAGRLSQNVKSGIFARKKITFEVTEGEGLEDETSK